MSAVSWVLHICTIVALLTTLALALTVVVRSCEVFKQTQAGVSIQQFSATQELREGDLVSDLDGVLFPLQRTSSPTTVAVEPPCKAQHLHNHRLVQITENKFFAPNKGETGLVIAVRKFEHGSFSGAKRHEAIPRALCSSTLTIHCSPYHVVVCNSTTVAVFPCDWATCTIQPCCVLVTDCPIGPGIKSVSTDQNLTLFSLVLLDGVTMQYESGGWTQRDKQDGWTLQKHSRGWSLQKDSLVSELPGDIANASLCGNTLFWVVASTGWVWFKQLDAGNAWTKPQALLQAISKGTQIIASCSTALLVSIQHGSVLLQISQESVGKLHVAADIPECDEMSVLNANSGSLLVALKGPQGISLFGHVPRWTMQPSSTFIGLVVKQEKKVAFVVRKGPVQLKKFMADELGSSGMLVLNTKTNTMTKQAQILDADQKVCAQFSGKSLVLES